jgi:hypothetical protein
MFDPQISRRGLDGQGRRSTQKVLDELRHNRATARRLDPSDRFKEN